MMPSSTDKPNESPGGPSEKEISDTAATLARSLQPESAEAKSSLRRLARIWLETPDLQKRRFVILDFILQEWGLQQADTPGALHQTAEMARKTLGQEHPTTLRALFNLGALWHKQGRLSEAETQIRLVLEILGRVPDPGQTGLLDPAQNLMISILESQGKTEEAAARRASLWPTPVLGVLDSCPGGEQRDSAAAAASRQKAQQALTNAQRLLWLLRPVNTPPEIREGVGLRNYHEAMLDPAESCAGRAATDCAGHPEYEAEAHAALGQAFKLLGRPVRAETEFHLGLALCRKIKGDNHEGVRWLLRELALVLLEQAKLGEAENVMRDDTARFWSGSRNRIRNIQQEFVFR
jgi:tetratricopeptide (TPR) repeat protein